MPRSSRQWGLLIVASSLLLLSAQAVKCPSGQFYVNSACRTCGEIISEARELYHTQTSVLGKLPCETDADCVLAESLTQCYGACAVAVPKVALKAHNRLIDQINTQWCGPTAFRHAEPSEASQSSRYLSQQSYGSFCPMMMPGCAVSRAYCHRRKGGQGKCRTKSALSRIVLEPQLEIDYLGEDVEPKATGNDGNSPQVVSPDIPLPVPSSSKLPIFSPTPSAPAVTTTPGAVPTDAYGYTGYPPNFMYELNTEQPPETSLFTRVNQLAQNILNSLGLF